MADLYMSNVPKSSQQTVIVICCLFLTVSWITVVLRIWVRAGLLRNFGWDDATMLLTTVRYALTAYDVLLTYSRVYSLLSASLQYWLHHWQPAARYKVLASPKWYN